MSKKREEEEGSGGFKVKDSRRFDEEGNPREGEEEPERERPEKTPEIKAEQSEYEKTRDNPACSDLPPIDFLTFISSLATGALISLGELELEDGSRPPMDLIAARQHIDILDLLEQKTKGNLNEDESRFLKRIIADLKWKFVECCSQKPN